MNIARTEHNNNRLSATSAVSAATNGAISGVATNGAAFHHTPAAQVIINGLVVFSIMQHFRRNFCFIMGLKFI